MENHPIPQDVTGFQFKLIGNMTVRQFAYLSTGGILAWIFFSIGISFLIKFPIALFCVFGGVSFAFLPIEGRPLDTMMLRFIKALFSPNQFFYQKQQGQLAFTPVVPPKPSSISPALSGKDIQSYINKMPLQPKSPLDEKETLFLNTLTAYSNPIPQTQPKKEEASEPPRPAEVDHQKVTELEQQLANISSQKQQLEQQLTALTFTPFAPAPQQSPSIHNVPKSFGVKIGLPITSDNPNLIVGIVKDPRGNILPNILVEVKDKEGNPVRAFKTNTLGQFASATSLLNGVYSLELEDPSEKNTFDAIEITASGQVIPPLEIFSTDQREQLRKELFGT